ncbi:MAM domain [Mactra antiquata]
MSAMFYFTLVFFCLYQTTLCQLSFDPGCSFSNGQCIYNVKLGHEGQCDSAGKRATTDATAQPSTSGSSSSGLQSCSCKDIDGLNANMNTLWSSITKLQNNFNNLAQELNVTQEQLGMKESELAALLTDKNNIQALLTSNELLLNKSKAELASTVETLNKELDRLRATLGKTSDDLSVCKTSLNMVDPTHTTPVLYGDFVTHYCDFEEGTNCNYTIESCTGSAECWYKGTGRQNVYSGPIEDHTLGAPSGHYMFINPEASPPYHSSTTTSSAYRSARLTSPIFPPSNNYCVRFWYTMHGSDTGSIRVYAQVGGGDGYPVYTKKGDVDKDWHMGQIQLDSEYTASPFRIVFEADTNSYRTYTSGHDRHYNLKGYTSIDDVYVYNTSCSNVPTCPAGSRRFTANNVTSCYSFHVTPKSWNDAVKVCKMEAPNGHLVSVNSQKEQGFLYDTISNDASLTYAGTNGWYTSGNDERNENHFKWTDTGYPYDLNYTNWHMGQPNNVGDVQNCLLLQYRDAKYEWGDVNCADKHPFICEIHI